MPSTMIYKYQKYIPFFFYFVMPLTTFSHETTTTTPHKAHCYNSIQQQELDEFINEGSYIGITTMEQSIIKKVDDTIGSFEISTLNLSSKDLSQEALAEWYMNIVNLNKLAFNAIDSLGTFENTEIARRVAISLVNGIVARWLTKAMGTTMHERAHGQAWEKTGKVVDVKYGTMDNEKNLSIGKLFVEMLKNGDQRGYAEPVLKDGVELSATENAVAASAGINANTSFAEKMENQIVRSGKFHNAESVHYLYNKFYLPYYAHISLNSEEQENDPVGFAQALADQEKIKPTEVNSTIRKMRNYSLLSAVLSGRTWDAVKSNVNYLSNGEVDVEVTSVETSQGKVTMPDFNTYLNTDSISIKGKASLIKENGNIYTAGYEKTVVGKSTNEFSLQSFIPTSERLNVELEGRANDDHGWGGAIGMTYNSDNRWYLIGRYDYDKNTLDGIRRNHNHDRAGKSSSHIGMGFKF